MGQEIYGRNAFLVTGYTDLYFDANSSFHTTIFGRQDSHIR